MRLDPLTPEGSAPNFCSFMPHMQDVLIAHDDMVDTILGTYVSCTRCFYGLMFLCRVGHTHEKHDSSNVSE